MRVYIENSILEEEYIIEFIFQTIGLPFLMVSQIEDANFIYIEKGSIEINKSLKNSIIFEKCKTDVVSEYLINKSEISLGENNIYGFDIINAIGFFLFDEGNKNLSKDSFDEHQRLKFRNSFQFINGIADFPAVNKYILYLKEILIQRLKKKPISLYPQGKKACVILSHDVDNPGKYDHLINYSLKPKTGGFKNYFAHYRAFLALVKTYFLDKNKNQYWVFEELMKAEKEYGFTSTSFFASVNFQSKNGHPLDVSYRLEQKKYKNIIKKLIGNGFDVGLHASYQACLNFDSLKKEKEDLEKIAGNSVEGLRHHFWHLGKTPNETLLKHENAGFNYDSSLAFNDHIGYRRNIALPYFPYNKNKAERLNTLQIPVFCMDGNLFYNEKMEVEEAVNKILAQIKVIEECNGVASIDWHIRSSIPNVGRFSKWGEAYLSILEELSKREDIWVTNCGQFSDWWIDRLNLN